MVTTDPYYRARRARREADFVTARRLALQSQCRPAPWQCPKCDAIYPSAGCPVCDAVAEAWAGRVSLPDKAEQKPAQKEETRGNEWDICPVCDLSTLYCKGH